MLPGPGLAVENTARGSYWLASILCSAEARRKGVLWEDWSTTREEAKAGQGWPSGAGTQGTPATVSPALVCLSGPPLVTSNIPEGSGLSFSHLQRTVCRCRDQEPEMSNGC